MPRPRSCSWGASSSRGFALLWSVEPTFSFAADPSTPAEVAQSHRRLVLVTWCAVVGGLLLLAHAVWRRLAVWATLLGITWLVCTVLAVLTLSATAPQPPAQRWTPPPGYCAEYSGGDSDCPGG